MQARSLFIQSFAFCGPSAGGSPRNEGSARAAVREVPGHFAGDVPDHEPKVLTVCMDAARLGGRDTPSNVFYLPRLNA
eukprot:5641811-Lingulodinium_polyedra.AAC.1